MKSFKKFNLILLLALLVTVGGVYASWSYSQGTVAQADFGKKVEMGAVVVDSPKGKIDIVDNGVSFIVDNDGNYNTVLSIKGSLVVSFTPAADADADVKANGIKLKIQVVSDFGQYNGVDIFTIHGGHELNGGNPILGDYVVYGQSTDPSHIDVLANHIGLGSFNLPTKADYDNFNDALSGKKLTIIISEA